MAHLIATLNDRSQSAFTVAQAAEITGLSNKLTSSLLYKAVRRGLVSRLKRGLYVLVPAELGSATEYAGDPLIVAKQLAGNVPFFISYASAMEIHRLVTQPQLVTFVSSSKRIPNRIVQGTEFRFVCIKPDHFFGTMKHWVTKQESVEVSDLERTIVDGLHQPQYAGGISEVAKGLWMRHKDIDFERLVEYALRLRVRAVSRRLGYLLEVYSLGGPRPALRLRDRVNRGYIPLDPLLPKEGRFLNRWGLQLNVSREELEAVRAT